MVMVGLRLHSTLTIPPSFLFPPTSSSSSFLNSHFHHQHRHRHRHVILMSPSSDYKARVSVSDELFSDASESDSDLDDHDPLLDSWHVLGLGQAMVDFSGVVDYDFLVKLGLEKGTRKLVNHEERGKVLRAMDGCTYKAAAGGSLSNTLVALARLGTHSLGAPPLNIAMAGSVGSDPLGGFYRY